MGKKRHRTLENVDLQEICHMYPTETFKIYNKYPQMEMQIKKSYFSHVDSSEQVHSAVSISLPHFTFKILFMAFITNIRH